MPQHRLFIIAPSLARLIQKERGGERVIEGYFPDHAHRSTFVQIEETRSSLILEAGVMSVRGASGPASGPCPSPARGQPGSGRVRADRALDWLTRNPGPSFRQARSSRSGRDRQDRVAGLPSAALVRTGGQRRARLPAPAPGSGWGSGGSRGGSHECRSQQPARPAGGPGHNLAGSGASRGGGRTSG